MSRSPNGQLIPVGGGDVIPLVREKLTLGRRESCDICLRFPNVSGLHCELRYHDGYWVLQDLGSTNGVKVNGVRSQKKVLHPGDTITIAKRDFKIEYEQHVGQTALEEILEDSDDVLDVPLLEKAGLIRPPRNPKKPPTPTSRRPWEDDGDEDD